jgi:hypothetical protein
MSAVVSKEEKESLEQSLAQNTPFSIGNKLQCAFSLTKRPQVLSGIDDNGWENNCPVANLHKVSEYWQLNKFDLMEKIKNSFPDMSKNKLYDKIISLFDVIQHECGINFSKEGGRLGNFEFYNVGEYLNAFEVITQKEEKLLMTVIRKKEPIERLLYVSCAAESEGRWISDECKQFLADECELRFHSKEPMVRVKVKIWDAHNGELVFVFDCTLMMECTINLRFS